MIKAERVGIRMKSFFCFVKNKLTLNNIKIITSIIVSVVTILVGYQSYKLAETANSLTKENLSLAKGQGAVDFFLSSNGDEILIEASNGTATNITIKVYYDFYIKGYYFRIDDTEDYRKKKNAEVKNWSIEHANFDYMRMQEEINNNLDNQYKCTGEKKIIINYVDYEGNVKSKNYIEKISFKKIKKEDINRKTDLPREFFLDTNNYSLERQNLGTWASNVLPENNTEKKEIEDLMIISLTDAFSKRIN